MRNILLVLFLNVSAFGQTAMDLPTQCHIEDGRRFVRHYDCPARTRVAGVRVLSDERFAVVEVTCVEIKVVCESDQILKLPKTSHPE